MGRFQIPNLAHIRKDDAFYYNAFKAVQEAIQNHSDQGNLDPTSAEQAAPPSVSKLTVVEKGGIHDIKIEDHSPAYAGLNYVAEYSQDRENWHAIDMGISQNHRANLGAGQYYWRAHSFYHPATPSEHVYHGGGTPSAVGSGSYEGPDMQEKQGFTGLYRNSDTPPIRK